jgi:S1-C subfamily serine protease
MGDRFAIKLLSLIFVFAGGVTAQSPPPRKDIPAIAKAANGAIVSIVMSDKDGSPIAQGSGFLVSKDGVIVTNYHVISEGSSAVVKFPDGAFYVVDGVLAFDKARDVAVIKAHGENFKTLSLGNSDQLQVGEEVVAIGNPLSLESTVSNGIVSGIRTVEEEGGKFLQVTTPISPGSSGGPLFNMTGEVVGITTLYLKGGENLNFAIPINDAKRLLLSKPAKIQDFPNQPEQVEAQTHDVGVPHSAHDYYQQLYDAGGFSEDNPAYVCFSDDGDSGTFFTFRAYAYDEYFGTTVQQKAPYVSFMSKSAFNALNSDLQVFFRRGRILEETVYENGVKVNALEYHWDGNSWFFPIPPTDPNAYTRTSKVLHLSIEPTTMRYVDSMTVTITVGNGETAATQTDRYGPFGGVCQKFINPAVDISAGLVPKPAVEPEVARNDKSVSSTPTTNTTGASFLWVGRFQREDRAHEAEKKITALGLPAAVLAKHGDNGDFYVVYSGPYLSDKVADAVQKLAENGFSNVRAVPVPLLGKNAKQ